MLTSNIKWWIHMFSADYAVSAWGGIFNWFIYRGVDKAFFALFSTLHLNMFLSNHFSLNDLKSKYMRSLLREWDLLAYKGWIPSHFFVCLLREHHDDISIDMYYYLKSHTCNNPFQSQFPPSSDSLIALIACDLFWLFEMNFVDHFSAIIKSHSMVTRNTEVVILMS